MKIYVASSWRNKGQPQAVDILRQNGHEVYDFRNPNPGDNGFHWSGIDKDWQTWSPKQFIDNLSHPIAQDGYMKDFKAMIWADACVMVMPCGRSAHLEAGYFVGANKVLVILTGYSEPELMYNLADKVCTTMGEVTEFLSDNIQTDSHPRATQRKVDHRG